MKILGVDPGTATTGIGIIEGSNKTGFKHLHYQCILTKANLPIQERLETIYTELTQIIKKYKPDMLALETLFFNTNPKTAMSVGRASGVIILCAEQNKLKFVEFTPLQVKVAVAGYGRAEKQQVQKMVKLLLNLKEIPKPDDAADALAIALCAGVSIKI